MADDLPTVLRMWRAGADLTIEQLASAANLQLPKSHQYGRETFRRYEKGLFPASGPNPLLLAAIAEACGRRIGDLPIEVQADAAQLAELLRSP